MRVEGRLSHGADDREELYDGVAHRARDRLRLLELLQQQIWESNFIAPFRFQRYM